MVACETKLVIRTFVLCLALAALCAATNWPEFHFDAANTGSTSDAGPTINTTLWTFDTTGKVGGSAAVANGFVFTNAKDKKVLYRLNATTGAQSWNYTAGGNLDSSPAVSGGIVYVGSDDNKLYALNETTGGSLWNYTTGNKVKGSPAVSGGFVYFGSDDKKVYSLNAATGALNWSYTTADLVQGSPAISGGFVYASNVKKIMYALNATTGTLNWSYTAGGNIKSSPAVSGSFVYFGCDDGKLYVLNAATGTLNWSYTTGANAVISSPAVSGGVVYFGTTDNNNTLFALNATSGAKIWNYTLPTGAANKIQSSPAIASNGIVYFGSDNNKVYAVNITGGTLVWSYSTTSNVLGSPAVSDSVLYIGSDDGFLYAFKNDTTAPVITLTYPLTNITTNRTINLTGTASDANPGSVYTNDSHFTVRTGTYGSWNFTNQTVLAEGAYSVLITANDTAGHTASVIANFTIDKTAPTITLTYPATNMVFNNLSHTLTLTGMASDAHPSSITTNDSHFTVNSGTFATWNLANQSALADGPYSVRITASDTAGYTASVVATFIVDRAPPSIALTYPLTNVLINHGISLTGTASDANNDSVYTNDTHFTVRTGTYGSWIFANQSALANGQYSVLITANDTAGKTSSVVANFTVDKTAPSITLTYNLTNIVINRAISLIGTASDAHNDSIYTNDSHFTVNGGTYGNWNFTNQTVLAEGYYSVLITANDTAGNTASVTANFTVDTTAPVIVLTYPLTNISVNYDMTLTGAASDAHLANVTTNDSHFTVNSGTTGTWNFANQTFLANSYYSVSITARDAAGNTASVVANFTIDTKAPKINLTYPATNILANHGINLTGTASDRNFDSIYTNDSHFTVNSGTYTNWNFTNQSTIGDGSYSVLITASDTAGNTASVIANFTAGRLATTLTLKAYPSWNVAYPTSTTVNCTADNLEVTPQLFVNGSLVAIPYTTTHGAGLYSYVCNATQTVGYYGATKTKNLTVSKITSTCSLKFNPRSPQVSGTSVNASCTCTNPEAGVALWRNSSDVTLAENNLLTVLPVGLNAYVCNVTATENYTSGTMSKSYTITPTPTPTSTPTPP